MVPSSKTPSIDGRYDVLAAACPTRQIVSRLGEKWTLLVLYALDAEPVRFRELQRRVEGISQRLLTQTLRNLERDGLVHRHAYAEVPLRVEYRLTPLGQSLDTAIAQIRHWAYAHIDEVTTARTTFGHPPADTTPPTTPRPPAPATPAARDAPRAAPDTGPAVAGGS